MVHLKKRSRVRLRRKDDCYLLVVGWGENVLFLGVSRELPGEDLLLDVGVGADFRNLQGHTLVHHLCI